MCQALLVADSGSGISAVLDGAGFIFINVDLTVALTRDPAGDWLLLEAETRTGSDGTGLATHRPVGHHRRMRHRPADPARRPGLTPQRAGYFRDTVPRPRAPHPSGIARGMTSDLPICRTCGVQYATPREDCPICLDERQYVGWGGQQWTTMAELAARHRTELREEEPDLIGVGVEPSFAIGQRALLVRTPHGNVLWDCISVLDDAGRERIAELGGIAAICISHPHFYGANVEIADAFGARILLPHADKEWIQRPSPRIELFDEQAEPVPGLTVARIGGHFDGAAVLHWPAGSDGRGALLTGDTITVVPDRRFVSFMWSYPNLIPLDEATVQDIARRVERFAFDRIYGGWWGRIVVADGPAAIRRSADRYVARLHGERP